MSLHLRRQYAVYKNKLLTLHAKLSRREIQFTQPHYFLAANEFKTYSRVYANHASRAVSDSVTRLKILLMRFVRTIRDCTIACDFVRA